MPHGRQIRLSESDLPPHLRARMLQRGVTVEEIELTLSEGWEASDAKSGTKGKTLVFPYQKEWEGQFFEEKEVTVYYKIVGEELTMLTIKARHGKDFPRR